MTDNVAQIPVPKARLKFIDLARSIAILLMLEGHFVDLTLDRAYRDYAYPAYAAWEYIRGFTSSMFLTVTGVVFVYLMLNNHTTAFWKNIRVKKGFKRVVELLFWGYLLQFNAFHVLQCIAWGILFILLIYGFYRFIKVIPLWVLYFTAGTAIFWSYLLIVQIPKGEYWPQNAPVIIQNMFQGPNSVFAIVPFLGFTMFGAAIGAILFSYGPKVKKWSFMIIFSLIGIFFFSFSKLLLLELDFMVYDRHELFYKLDWLYERLGMVMMILGGLMIIEKVLKDIRQSLFLKVGQNTLTIFIIHMIVLYGAVFDWVPFLNQFNGINDYFNVTEGLNPLNPYQAAFGALLFITFHVILIKNIELIKKKLNFILLPISNFWAKIYKFD